MNDDWEKECWTTKLRLAPFNKKTGSLESYYDPATCELKKADFRFEAILFLRDYERGRSAIRLIWIERETGKMYPMFIGKFFDMIGQFTKADSYLSTFPTVSGVWGFCKQGSNYGIEFFEEL